MRAFLTLTLLLPGCALIQEWRELNACEEGEHLIGEECFADVPPYVIPGPEDSGDSDPNDSDPNDSADTGA